MTYKEQIAKTDAEIVRIRAIREEMESEFRKLDKLEAANQAVARQFSRNIWGDNPAEIIGYDLGEGITHQPMIAVRD